MNRIGKLATLAFCATLMVLLVPGLTTAQPGSFPSRPITVIVPFPPGGSSDVVTRLVAQKVADNLKTNIVIDNRGGGGGVPAAIATKQAAPDGYTLFLTNNGLFAIMPALDRRHSASIRSRISSRSRRCSRSRACWWCRPNSPAKTVKELVELAKSKPGGLNFASQGVGSGGHILGEMLRLRSGAPFVHVPYRGAGPAVQRPRRRQRRSVVQRPTFRPIGQVQGGKLRDPRHGPPTKRSPALPDVPTMAEAGFPGIELEIWQGIVAPAGTPPAIVRKLNAEFIKAAQSPDIVQQDGGAGRRNAHQHAGGIRQADHVRHRSPGQGDPRRRHQGAVERGRPPVRAIARDRPGRIDRPGTQIRAARAGTRGYCAVPPAPSVAVSTFTPGPMVEEIATRLM